MENRAVLNLSCPDMLPSEREVSLKDSDLGRQGNSLDGFETISFDPSTRNVDGNGFSRPCDDELLVPVIIDIMILVESKSFTISFLKEWGKSLELVTTFASASMMVVQGWSWYLASLAKESFRSTFTCALYQFEYAI
ncbi:hypothetical protein TNIN_417101 [Trichonephila inaurata madagascariensis]|uniref:Uncharacterized protein n=1 Tax=Trichonephila inaurata madagascariensis TaxID=2747483 RepID=A0A8X7CAT3_9ARAC|nr:hypothetical protein TNIN_417101 [Trichonephila inaurata madagascariensis]